MSDDPIQTALTVIEYAAAELAAAHSEANRAFDEHQRARTRLHEQEARVTAARIEFDKAVGALVDLKQQQ